MPTATKKVEAWFDWPGDPDKARVKFSLLTPQDGAEVEEASTKRDTHWNHETQKTEFHVTTNLITNRKKTALKVTHDWENFFDGNRKPMECTRENVEFWACDSSFYAFLMECQVKLQIIADEQLEEARKNS